MCRHLGYLGPPRALHRLLEAPHGLCEQGRRPREMVVANENPDGWGIAWWEESGGAPHWYRTTTRMWDDKTFADRDRPAIAALGAVRRASPGSTLQTANNAPFVADTRRGAIAFSLNGDAFRGAAEDRLRSTLAPGTELAGDTDSEVLFALVRQRIDGGGEVGAALAAVHAIVDPDRDTYVNLMAVTRDQLCATTWNHTLYVHHASAATTLASEPLDTNPGWSRIPDSHLVVANKNELKVTPLNGLR